MKEVLVICGPTATGKSDLATECAKILESEVVSADSQMVYKGLDIGTAKPTEKDMRGIRHHMIDVVSPSENFSVADYRDMAMPVVKSLIKRGKVPVICGGTGFYINSLLFDYSYGAVSGDMETRKKYEKIEEDMGKEYLFSILKEKDPETAEKLHVNDVKRVIRALEMADMGQKKSSLSDGTKPVFTYTAVAVDYPRDELYERIDMRVDRMFEAGLVEEVRGLMAKGYGKCRCMDAIGYKEIIESLENNETQCNMRDKIAQNTRRFAKRQITFFKKMPGLVWLRPEDADAQKITEMLDA